MYRFWVIIVVFSLSACQQEQADNGFYLDSTAFLTQYTDNLLLPAMAGFSSSANQLTEDIRTYCNNPSVASRSQAQAQWIATAKQWQKLEMMQVGPIAANDFLLRSRIWSYSDTQKVNQCLIDQSTLNLAENNALELDLLTANQVGLTAIEYLLFTNNELFSCNQANTDELAAWARLTLEIARCDHAEILSQSVAGYAQDLHFKWKPEGQNYRAQFIQKNNAGNAIQAISDALFYVDTQLKDLKLGVPLGLNTRCGPQACPQLVEAPFSEQSLVLIAENLSQFRSILTGADGYGFDDIMVDKGQSQLRDDFLMHLDEAEKALNRSLLTLKKQATLLITDTDAKNACINAQANPNQQSELPLCQLHGWLKRISDDLKTGFIAVVDLDIPQRAQSDND